jgi:hypothetical protein
LGTLSDLGAHWDHSERRYTSQSKFTLQRTLDINLDGRQYIEKPRSMMQDQGGDMNPIPIVPLPLYFPLPLPGARSVIVPEIRRQILSLLDLFLE